MYWYVKLWYVLKNNKMLEECWINLMIQIFVVIWILYYVFKVGQIVCEYWEDSGSQDGFLDLFRGGQVVGFVFILYDVFCCYICELFLNIFMYKKILFLLYKLYIVLIVYV